MIFGHRPKTLDQLGQRAKRLNPGQYDTMDDLELGREIQKAYPGEYDDYREPSPKRKQRKETFITNLIGGAGRLLGAQAEGVSKFGIAPIAKQFADPEAKKRIETLQGKEGTVYPSDVLEQVIPQLKEEDTSTPEYKSKIKGMSNEEFLQHMITQPFKTGAKTAARFAADIAFDPLTYETFGGNTLLGRTVKSFHEALQAGEKIKLYIKPGVPSKIAKDIMKIMKVKTPSPQMVTNFKKKFLMEGNKYVGPSRSLTQGISKGERNLFEIGPLAITGPNAAKVTAPLTGMRRSQVGSQVEQGIRELLSTKTGHHDYDVLFSKAKDVAFYEESQALKMGKTIRQNVEDLSRELGKPPEVIIRELRALTEVKKKLPASTYSREIRDLIEDSIRNKKVDAQVALAKAQKAGAPPQAIELLARQVAEHNGDLNMITGKYNPLVASDPKVAKAALEISQWNHAELMKDIAGGVEVKPLLADIEHIAHVMTPEARQRLREIAEKEGKSFAKMSQKEISDFLANSIRREFAEVNTRVVDAWLDAGFVSKQKAKALKGSNGMDHMDELLKSGKITEDQFNHAVHSLDIPEVNALGQQGKIRSFGTESLEKIFHDDPAFATTVRGMRGARARVGAEFYREMVARKIALPEAQAPAHWFKAKPTELEGYRVPPEVAKHLNRYSEIVTNPLALKKFMQNFDHYNGLLKAWTIGIFPGYHIQNVVGNFWNNSLADIDMKSYIDAIRVGSQKGNYKLTDVFGKTWTSKELLLEAKKLGIVDRGWYHTDAATTVQREWNKKGFRPKELLDPTAYITPSSRNLILRSGLAAGKTLENNARLAHFIGRLKQGDTVEQAALSVKKYLFDYNDLSNFERNKLNRLFWFYTWSRKNIPLQLQSLVTKPYRYGLPFKLKHEIEKNVAIDPENEKYLQDYYKERFPLRVKKDAKTGKYLYFLLDHWLPALDILKLAHIHDVALNMLHPLPKELIQQLWETEEGKTGFDVYKHKPIERYSGEKETFLGIPMRKRVVHGLRVIRLLNEIDKMTKEDTSLFAKTTSILTGKTIEFDPNTAAMYNAGDVDEKIKMLEQGMEREARKSHPNEKEIERIGKMIEEITNQY